MTTCYFDLQRLRFTNNTMNLGHIFGLNFVLKRGMHIFFVYLQKNMGYHNGSERKHFRTEQLPLKKKHNTN